MITVPAEVAQKMGLSVDLSTGASTPLFDESAIRGLIIDMFDQVGFKYVDQHGDTGNRRVIGLDQLLDGIEEHIVYLVEERKWNLEHGLTATCPECGRAMTPDKTWCSHRCYHAYREVLRENGIDDPTSAEAARLVNKENQ